MLIIKFLSKTSVWDQNKKETGLFLFLVDDKMPRIARHCYFLGLFYNINSSL